MAKTYYLTVTIKGPDSKQMVSVPWNWQNDSREPRLKDVREKLSSHGGFLGGLPRADAAWVFLDVKGAKIEEMDDEEAYGLKLWTKAGESGDNVELAVEVTEVPTDPAPPTPPPRKVAGDMDKIHVDVTVGSQPMQRLSFDKSAATVTLRELRTQLTNSSNVKFDRSSQFLAGEAAIAIPDEAGQFVASLDPTPTVVGDRGVYKVKARTPDRTVDLSIVNADPPPITAKPLGGPNTNVTSPPGGGGLTSEAPELGELQRWRQLDEEEQAKVALKTAKLFRGFNLPGVDVRDELGPSTNAGYRPLVEHSNRELYSQPPGLIKSDQRERLYSVENSGYSRVELQLKRSFSVSVSASMNYADQVSAEAAYGHARASRADRTEETFFLTADVFVPKAILEAPLSASGRLSESSQAYVLPEFQDQVDAMGTPADLYRLLKDWGSLIAGKVTVGGAFLFEERKTDLMSFDAASEMNSFKAKISGGNGVLTVGGGTAIESQQEWQKQVNENFKSTTMMALGGDPAAAASKDLPLWITTLASHLSWEAIRLENYYPVYLLLDDTRQGKFIQILGQAGRAGWRSQTILPSLRFIDYDWYIGFGQGQLFDDLFKDDDLFGD